MSAASAQWSRVSRRSPCPICGKPDWCAVTADGAVAYCMRIESSRQSRDGGWLHRLDGRTVPRSLPSLPTEPSAPRAPIARRDRIYRALADVLGLSASHRRHLLHTRSLPEAALHTGFASLPRLDSRQRHELAERVAIQVGGGSEVLRRVPGFAEWQSGWTLVRTAAGILVPVPDAAGRIQGCQVRADHPSPQRPRYTWLSSPRAPGGASSGVPAAVWRPELAGQGVWATEGSLKAAVAAHHLPACVLAVAGVACWREMPDVLAGLLPDGGPAVVAYDMDAEHNPAVAHHREALALAMYRAGYAVQVATWDGATAKGLDDALLAGAPITVRSWRRRLPTVTRPQRSQRLPQMKRPRAVPLASVLVGNGAAE